VAQRPARLAIAEYLQGRTAPNKGLAVWNRPAIQAANRRSALRVVSDAVKAIHREDRAGAGGTMKGSFSLADELRAIRNGSRNDKLARPTPNPEKDEKPWQRDLERMQEEIREMLRSVSFFSGIDADSGHQSPDGSVPRLDFNALKDKIRNDLETFSLTTTEELTKRAEEEARAKLEAIESEVQGKIDQVAVELREKLQGQIVPEDLEAGITQQTRDRVTEMVRARTDEFA
jgi:ElaB/YqjD/DUF883 family membrane-anchored ribosome-binding protein